MQAIRVHHFGDVDALVVEDVPRPAPGEGEVLLRVTAFEAGELTTNTGDVLSLADARIAHEMLAGRPHKRGKIVLRVDP